MHPRLDVMESTPVSASSPGSFTLPDDGLTVALVGGAAYVTAAVAHETIGHGAACLVSGGHVLCFSSVHIVTMTRSGFIDLAGPCNGLLAGGLFWLLLRRMRRASTAVKLFLWLAMASNLLWATGYIPYSCWLDDGDWLALIRGCEPQWAWRAAFGLAGAAAYVGVVLLAAAELRAFTAGGDDATLRRRSRRLVLIAYLAAGVTACAAGALDPGGAVWAITNNSAPASFLAGIGLLFVPWLRGRMASVPEAGRTMVSRTWGLALWCGALVGVFIAVLGRGIRPF